MDASLGRIKAHLAESDVGPLTRLVELINQNINPPNPVEPSDVHIRAMYIVSDEVNSFGGRFPAQELGRLTELLIDSPVMVGHRKDRLPVARTFHARIVERDGRQWVKSYFYWLRSSRGAEDLKENIDGGIYKECSIGFTYRLPECSICGKDIRTCRHEPLVVYDDDRKPCHFNYRDIERVLETSLVYRGAVRDTAISNDLTTDQSGQTSEGDARKSPVVISNPAVLPLDQTYLVIPYYESIPVTAVIEDGKLDLTATDGERIDHRLIVNSVGLDLPELEKHYGFLLGYRGKQRCSVDSVRKYLNGKKGVVTRVELKLMPSEGLRGESLRDTVIRHAHCKPPQLPETARRLATKEGVRLWSSDKLPPVHSGFVFQPSDQDEKTAGLYRVTMLPGGREAALELSRGEDTLRYVIRQFHAGRFKRGCRFIADEIDHGRCQDASDGDATMSGVVMSYQRYDDGLTAEVNGAIRGRIAVQRVKLNRRQRYLVFLAPPSTGEKEHERE